MAPFIDLDGETKKQNLYSVSRSKKGEKLRGGYHKLSLHVGHILPENDPVLPDLHEEDLPAGAGAGMDSEGLTVHLAGRQRLQVNVVPIQVVQLLQQVVDLLAVHESNVALAQQAADLLADGRLAHLVDNTRRYFSKVLPPARSHAP